MGFGESESCGFVSERGFARQPIPVLMRLSLGNWRLQLASCAEIVPRNSWIRPHRCLGVVYGRGILSGGGRVFFQLCYLYFCNYNSDTITEQQEAFQDTIATTTDSRI